MEREVLKYSKEIFQAGIARRQEEGKQYLSHWFESVYGLPDCQAMRLAASGEIKAQNTWDELSRTEAIG